MRTASAMWSRLDLGRRIAIVDPFQTVGGDLPPRLVHGGDRFAIARHRGRDRIDGDGHGALGEHAVQPPEAGARAVFVDRLHVHVPHARPGRCADDFRQEGFRRRVAVQDVVLAAFLVIDDELHRHARVCPASRRRAASVRSRPCRADSFRRSSSPCIPHVRSSRLPARRYDRIAVCSSPANAPERVEVALSPFEEPR